MIEFVIFVVGAIVGYWLGKNAEKWEKKKKEKEASRQNLENWS